MDCTVIPAEAGIQSGKRDTSRLWTPIRMGVTDQQDGERR